MARVRLVGQPGHHLGAFAAWQVVDDVKSQLPNYHLSEMSFPVSVFKRLAVFVSAMC